MIEPLQLPARGLAFDALAAGPPTGELVVLLHGFPQTSACWTLLLETLAAAGYRAVAPNQRGYSPTARPATVSAYRLPELVADVVAIADRLDAETLPFGRPRLGRGGGLAAGRPTARAGGHPDRRLDSPPAGLCQGAVRRHPGVAVGLHPGVPPPSAARAAAGRPPAVGAAPAAGPGRTGGRLVDTYTRALAQPGALSAALAWYRAATPFSLRAPRVSVPTLYVWGSGDPALGPRAAITTGRWITGAYRFEVLAGAGHWLPEHHAQELGRLLLEHLRRWKTRPTAAGEADLLTANAGPSHSPVEFTTSASTCPQRGRGAAIRQESEPGGDPPKPPGAASPPGPTTARGARNHRRDHVGKPEPPLPVSPTGRYSQAAALS
jgi:pimeloyl-ACP methyl ester carboxylesterase